MSAPPSSESRPPATTTVFGAAGVAGGGEFRICAQYTAALNTVSSATAATPSGMRLFGTTTAVRSPEVSRCASAAIIPAMRSSSRNTVCASAGRSLGFFARQCAISTESASGTSARSACSDSGVRVSCAVIVAVGEGAENGLAPISNSYASNPTA